MIKLEQIRELNEKVQSTLEVVKLLREENSGLKQQLTEKEVRVKELEVLVSSFRNDQDEIEEGIKGILLQLDRLEEEFTAPPTPRSVAAEVTEEPSSVEETDGAAASEADNASEAQESSISQTGAASSAMETAIDSEEVAVSSEEPSPEGSSDEGTEPEEIPAPAATEDPVEENRTQETITVETPVGEAEEAPAPAADSGETELDIF